MTRVALLHYSAPPVVGGVESVIAHQARLMMAGGHRVTIVAGRGEQRHDEISFVHLPLIDSRHPQVLEAKAELDAGRVPSHFGGLVDRIAQALRAVLSEIDIVIAHNVCSLHKNLALTAALHQLNSEGASLRFILWHHDLAWTTPRYRSELHAGYPWDLLRSASAWPEARHVVVSESRRQELANLFNLNPDQIVVVPNGIELKPLLKLEPKTEALLQQAGLTDAGPLLLLPVRLTPRKNIELALSTLAELRKVFPDAKLVVTGPEGPHNPANAEYKARLLRQRDDLSLRGAAHFLAEYTDEFLPDEVIADFFRLADALFLSSREEGFGIPLIEAALTRLPVFCADIPPLRELGSDDVVYFSPEERPDIVAAMIYNRLKADPAYRFSRRARRSYAWSSIYAKHIEPLLASN